MRSSSCAALAEAEDVDLMLLHAEPVAPAQLGCRWGAAELGLLDGATRGAHEVMVVTGVAAHVGWTPVVDELTQGACLAQELDRAIDGGEPELWVELAGVVEELEWGERAVEPDDRV